MQNTAPNPFTYKTRVYIEDTDYGGIVYYPNYLKFMERARSELLFYLGFTNASLLAENCQFVVRRVAVEYLKPAHLNDLIEVTASVSEMGRSKLIFSQAVHNAENPELIYCHGEVFLVCVDKDIKPMRLPEHIKNALSLVI